MEIDKRIIKLFEKLPTMPKTDARHVAGALRVYYISRGTVNYLVDMLGNKHEVVQIAAVNGLYSINLAGFGEKTLRGIVENSISNAEKMYNGPLVEYYRGGRYHHTSMPKKILECFTKESAKKMVEGLLKDYYQKSDRKKLAIAIFTTNMRSVHHARGYSILDIFNSIEDTWVKIQLLKDVIKEIEAKTDTDHIRAVRGFLTKTLDDEGMKTEDVENTISKVRSGLLETNRYWIIDKETAEQIVNVLKMGKMPELREHAGLLISEAVLGGSPYFMNKTTHAILLDVMKAVPSEKAGKILKAIQKLNGRLRKRKRKRKIPPKRIYNCGG